MLANKSAAASQTETEINSNLNSENQQLVELHEPVIKKLEKQSIFILRHVCFSRPQSYLGKIWRCCKNRNLKLL